MRHRRRYRTRMICLGSKQFSGRISSAAPKSSCCRGDGQVHGSPGGIPLSGWSWGPSCGRMCGAVAQGRRTRRQGARRWLQATGRTGRTGTARSHRSTSTSSSSGPASPGCTCSSRLRRLGVSTVVLEAGDDVGGTWYWNRYPGARCDIQTIDYSYSLRPRARGRVDVVGEVRHPARDPALRRSTSPTSYDLRTDIRFATRVDGGGVGRRRRRRGQITTGAGDTITCRWYVMATGCLSVPKEPDIAGHRPLPAATCTSRAAGRTRASTSPASASPSSAPARRASSRSRSSPQQAARADRVPAHAELLAPGPATAPPPQDRLAAHRRRPRGLPRRGQVVARRRARASRRRDGGACSRREEQLERLEAGVRGRRAVRASSACSPTR